MKAETEKEYVNCRAIHEENQEDIKQATAKVQEAHICYNITMDPQMKKFLARSFREAILNLMKAIDKDELGKEGIRYF
jgi:hypothetical protein